MSFDVDVSGAKLNFRVSSDNLAAQLSRESTQDLRTRKQDLAILIALVGRAPACWVHSGANILQEKLCEQFAETERSEARTGHACGERLE